RLWKIFERPHHCSVRVRDLECESLPGAIGRIIRMAISPLAGKPAPKEMLVDLSRLEREYFDCRPDVDDPAQRVSFGTSGHRGSPFHGSFTEAHIRAITQAICDDPPLPQVQRTLLRLFQSGNRRPRGGRTAGSKSIQEMTTCASALPRITAGSA